MGEPSILIPNLFYKLFCPFTYLRNFKNCIRFSILHYGTQKFLGFLPPNIFKTFSYLKSPPEDCKDGKQVNKLNELIFHKQKVLSLLLDTFSTIDSPIN